MELALVYQKISDLRNRSALLRSYLAIDAKCDMLEEVTRALENPNIWSKPKRAQALSQQKSQLAAFIKTFKYVTDTLADSEELLMLAESESDEATISVLISELEVIKEKVEKLEFEKMFDGKLDNHHAYLGIQSGSGGTEAQDWAEMLLRMYLRWSERHRFRTTLTEVSPGEVAGIKSATIHIKGSYAFGWLRSETGVHRLVRKSPFNANSKRHTSFASVFVSPEIDDDISIDINPQDLRIDTYRASGAGGQHVNKTESAVRVTHLLTNVVVQCQDGRSQHNNKEQAMRQLRSKLYELEMQKRNREQKNLEESKADIGWGQQIRSYVLDQSRIKDLRTGFEVNNTQAVLDGDLDNFITASLKAE